MSAVATKCGTCWAATQVGDRFCGECGSPLDGGVEAAAYCSRCGGELAVTDAFCSYCGADATEDLATAGGHRQPAGTEGRPPSEQAASPAPSERVEQTASPAQPREPAAPKKPLPPAALLSADRPFCRACGADHDPGVESCPTCSAVTGPLPARIAGDLGAAHMVRRKVRKRRAIAIGTEGTTVTLLFESGDTVAIDRPELPPPAELDLPLDLPTARTPHGRLLAVAEAVRAGKVRYEWDADALVEAALDAVDGLAEAGLVAVDAMSVGRADLFERLDLTESERRWLRSVDAVGRGDIAEAIAEIGGLPVAGYRHKLSLIACIASEARARRLSVDALGPHVEHYAGEEPIAGVLVRLLGFEASTAAAAEETRRVVELAPIDERAGAEMRAGLDAIAGTAPELPDGARLLGPHARAAGALLAPRARLVREQDVGSLPLPVLDDLIERDALAAPVVLAASAAPEVTRYLRGRLAPETLSDADVEQLGHREEAVRRAFRTGDAAALGEPGDDSPAVRHYRVLDAVRRRQLDGIALDDAHEEARPVVAALREIVAANADGKPVSDLLGETVLHDPTVWPVLTEIAGPTGIELTAELRDRFPRFGEWLALQQAREHLFKGSWQAAVAAADDCLALAHDEEIRDEALNLKACGLYYAGDGPAAIAALEEAIEGAYSDALLANIGVVAAALQPEVAARHLGVLIAEAPTIAMRVAAAHRALDIWSTSDTESWRNSDDSPLPDAFQDAIRALVVDDLEIDDFRALVRLLAVHDAKWMSDPANLRGSRHRDTLVAKYYVARATNLHETVEVMGAAMSRGEAPAWLLDERDSLRAATVELLIEDLNKPDSAFGTVALAMVDHDVLATAHDRQLLLALGIAGVAYHLSEQAIELSDEFDDRVRALREGWDGLDSDDKRQLEEIVELATRRVAINRGEARDRELSQALDVFRIAVERGSAAAPGSLAYADALEEIAQVARIARAAREAILPWLPLVDHSGVREDLDATVQVTRELEQACLEMLG